MLNFSGTTYDTADFASPVLDVTMNGPVPPLDTLIQLCTAVSRWLDADSARVVAAHGAEHNPEVVPFFFGCYLSWIGEFPHPKAGYLSVAAKLGFTESHLFPSNRRYFQYFELLQRGYSPQPAVLSQFSISGFEISEDCDIQHFTAELRQAGRLIKRSSVSSLNGANSVFELGEPLDGDINITLWDTYVSDGIAIGSGKPLAQISFHTGFAGVAEVLQFFRHDLDVQHTELASDVVIKVSLSLGGSKAALAAERLVLQVLLGAEGHETPAIAAQSNAGVSTIDIVDIAHKECDVINDVVVGDLTDRKLVNVADIEHMSKKLPPPSHLEDFFRELDALVQA